MDKRIRFTRDKTRDIQGAATTSGQQEHPPSRGRRIDGVAHSGLIVEISTLLAQPKHGGHLNQFSNEKREREAHSIGSSTAVSKQEYGT